VIFFHRQQS